MLLFFNENLKWHKGAAFKSDVIVRCLAFTLFVLGIMGRYKACLRYITRSFIHIVNLYRGIIPLRVLQFRSEKEM